MALLKEWHKIAYDEKKDKGTLQRFWANYFNLEKGVYEKLLSDPDTEVKGTVKELAEKYGLSVMEMTGFLDGINESLVEATNFVKTIETHQHRKIACLEEIAYLNGWITKEQVLETYEELKKNQYGRYLKDVLDGKYIDKLHGNDMK